MLEKIKYPLPREVYQALATLRSIIRSIDVAMWEHPRTTYRPQARHCLSAKKLLNAIIRRLGFINKQRGPGYVDLCEAGKLIELRDQLQTLAAQQDAIFPRMWRILRPGFPTKVFGEPITREPSEFKGTHQPGDQEMEISEDSSSEEDANVEAPPIDPDLMDGNYEIEDPDRWITELEEADLLKDLDIEKEIEDLFNQPMDILDDGDDTPMISPMRGPRPPEGVRRPPRVDWDPVRQHLGLPKRLEAVGQKPGASHGNGAGSRFQPMMTPGQMSEKIPAYFLRGPFPKKLDLKGDTLLRYYQKNLQPIFSQRFSGKTSPDSLTFQGFMKLFWNHIGQLDVPEEDKFTVLYQLLEGSAYNLVCPLILSLPKDAYRRALEILYANYGDVLVAKQRLDEHLELLKPEANSKVAQRNFVISVTGMYTRFLELEIPPTSFVPRLIERILRYVGGGATASYFQGMAKLGLKKSDFYVGNETSAFEDFTAYISEYLWSRAEIQDTLDLEVEALPGMPKFTDNGTMRHGSMVGAATEAPKPPPAKKHAPQKTASAPSPPPPPPQSAPLANADDKNNRPCFFCQKTGHPIHKCPLSTKERRQALVEAKRCFNCLQKGHPAKECSKDHNCHLCTKEQDEKGLQYKHITFICIKRDRKQKRNQENQGGPPNKIKKENDNARKAPKRIQEDALEMIQRYLSSVQVGGIVNNQPAAKAENSQEQSSGGQSGQQAATNPGPNTSRQD